MPETIRGDAVFGDERIRARTTNIDALDEEGVAFENAFVPHTVCSPSPWVQ